MAAVQVVIVSPESPPLIAGLPSPLRTAQSLASRDWSGPVVLCSRGEALPEAWRETASRLGKVTVAALSGPASFPKELSLAAPVLLLSGLGLPDVGGLERFVEEARGKGLRSAWVWNGAVVAAFFPSAEDLRRDGLSWRHIGNGRGPKPGAFGRDVPASPADWRLLESPSAVREAERALYEDLRGDSDGYLARYDRGLSIALSAALARTRVTPNQITTASLAVTLWGSWLLADPLYPPALCGAALLWAGCILDGCDGEVARLKLRTSPGGAAYDLAADHIGHAATFAAILLHVRRAHPELSWASPGAAFAAGVSACMFVVWRVILSKPPAERGRADKIFERIASRDYVYLVLLLASIGRLHWFVWGAAVGSHLFWIALLTASRTDASAKSAAKPFSAAAVPGAIGAPGAAAKPFSAAAVPGAIGAPGAAAEPFSAATAPSSFPAARKEGLRRPRCARP